MATRNLILLPFIVMLSGCSMAEYYDPVVDRKGAHGDYQSALSECRGYASQVNVVRDSLTGVAQGGLAGAAFGAALGAISGHAGTGAATGSVIGAAGGSTTIYATAQQRQITIINKCLERRGFAVLG